MPPTVPKGIANPIPGRHLGRKAPTDEGRKRAIPLRPFLKLSARPVPTSDDYRTKAQACLTQMMGNDQQGCCVATAIAKLLGMMAAYNPTPVNLVASTNEVLAWYHQVGGPGDDGLVMTDAYDYMVAHGIKIGSKVHKLDGYAAVDTTDAALLDACFHWFGGVGIGINLTRQQYEHASDSDTWDLDGTPVVGGHMVPLTTRAPDVFSLATWAMQPHVTRRAVADPSWCEEAYVALGPDWYNAAGMDTNAVNVDALRAALAAVKAGGTPDIPNDPNPPTPPPSPPGGPGTWSGGGILDFLGNKMPITIAGQFAGAVAANTAVQAVNGWAVLADLTAIYTDARRGDYVAVAADVEQLLVDLGISMQMDERIRFLKALHVRMETAALADKRPR